RFLPWKPGFLWREKPGYQGRKRVGAHSPPGEAIMKALRLILVVPFCLLVLSCGSKSKDLIVGKWECTDEGKDKGLVVEFNKDGTSSMSIAFLNLKAKYKFIDDNTIEMELENPFKDLKIEGVKMEAVKMDTKGTEKQKLKIAVT